MKPYKLRYILLFYTCCLIIFGTSEIESTFNGTNQPDQTIIDMNLPDGQSGPNVAAQWLTPKVVDDFTSNGIVQGIEIEDDIIYLAAGSDGLIILEVSASGSIAELGRFKHPTTPGVAVNLFITKTTLFLADSQNGLEILDITDLANPTEIGHYSSSEPIIDVVVSGNYAFIIEESTGITILDISDIDHVTTVGSTIDLPEAKKMAISGTALFIAAGETGLYSYDVSSPNTPAFSTTLLDGGSANDIVIDGKFAYVADGTQGLEIIIVENPSTPVEIGEYYKGSGESVGVCMDRGLVYLANGNDGIEIIDVINPATPKILNEFSEDVGNCVAVAASDYLVFGAFSAGGLKVIDNGFDLDEDGFTNWEEINVLNTDPTKRDSDSDFFSDDIDPYPNNFFMPTGLIGIVLALLLDLVLVKSKKKAPETASDKKDRAKAALGDQIEQLSVADIQEPEVENVMEEENKKKKQKKQKPKKVKKAKKPKKGRKAAGSVPETTTPVVDTNSINYLRQFRSPKPEEMIININKIHTLGVNSIQTEDYEQADLLLSTEMEQYIYTLEILEKLNLPELSIKLTNKMRYIEKILYKIRDQKFLELVGGFIELLEEKKSHNDQAGVAVILEKLKELVEKQMNLAQYVQNSVDSSLYAEIVQHLDVAIKFQIYIKTYRDYEIDYNKLVNEVNGMDLNESYEFAEQMVNDMKEFYNLCWKNKDNGREWFQLFRGSTNLSQSMEDVRLRISEAIYYFTEDGVAPQPFEFKEIHGSSSIELPNFHKIVEMKSNKEAQQSK